MGTKRHSRERNQQKAKQSEKESPTWTKKEMYDMKLDAKAPQPLANSHPVLVVKSPVELFDLI